MQFSTSRFGVLEINEEDIVIFEDGLPGFEEVNKFIVISDEKSESPFSWLQCIDNESLAFVMINPVYFKKDYTVAIDDLTINSLEIENPDEVLIFSIVVVPEDISKISANLKAPLLINTKNKKGKQVILDSSEYGVRHYIMEELKQQGG